MDEELPKILCVDDEPHVLRGLERSLYEHFDVTTAESGAEALELMQDDVFEVLMSDMRMPEMDGAELLRRSREHYPNTTRILLTGHADLESAMKAINQGNIFRFLMKPCETDLLVEALNEASQLYRLRRAEKDLLENTLKGTIKVLADILNIAAPEAFRTAFFIRRLAMHVVNEKQLPNRWEYDIAAMLCQLGALSLPEETLKRAFNSVNLGEDDKQMLKAIPSQGAQLLERIPRLGRVALMIESQFGTDADIESLPERVQVGARLLRMATWIETTKLRKQLSIQEAIKAAKARFTHEKDLDLLSALDSYRPIQETKTVREVKATELKIGMILEEDVCANSGSVVLSRGQELNGFLIDRLINFARGAGINEPIKVYC